MNNKMEALATQIGHTDKHDVHSYMPIYEKLFATRSIHTILEIGVLDGGSIKMWSMLYPEATVYGIDVDLSRNKFSEGSPNIILREADAYALSVANSLPLFDVIIDDGPHTLHSQKECLKLYLPKLRPGGVLIIEDVVNMSWIRDLTAMVKPEWRKHIVVHDLRHVKGRHDDIMFIVDFSH